MSAWVPPAYISVTALVREHGVHSVRNDLFSERRQAYKFDRTTGELCLIEPRFWGVDGAERCLEYGWLAPPAARHFKIGAHSEVPCMIVVQVEDEPQPATDGVYMSAFMRLMAAAGQHFNIRADSCPAKKTLVEYFRAQTVDGKPVTTNLAKQMATLCRPPEAMRGGNRKG